ncbi:hypothetical protein V8C35DRAFT_14196 [Trichoderma chlorosporum]
MDMPARHIPLFLDDDAKWQAVQTRNPDADGFFVYGVRTTKIFCRPTCKARLARRGNMRFYATGDEAKQNGFRACKRCKPEVLGLMPEEEAVQKIRAFVQYHEAIKDEERSMGEMKMSLSQMAKKTGLSKWHFHRVFKKCVGITPVEYLKTLRDKAAGCSPMTESDSGLSWTDQLDLINLEMDFDFGFLSEEPPTIDSNPDGAQAAPSSNCSPLSFEDLVEWPEDQCK